MRVIDVDSHFLEPPGWLSHVDPGLAREIPPCDPIEHIVRGVVGDLLELVPREQQPADRIRLLAPAGQRALAEMLAKNQAERELPSSSHDAAARLRLCDELGIEIQFLNPTLGSAPFAAAKHAGRSDLARRCLRAYNTWAAETLSGCTDRLIPIALIDTADVEGAVGELTRMRRGGSRAFQVRAEPAGETRSLAHPDLDPIWAAAADLGMAAIFHIGSGRADLGRGWYFNGRDPGQFAVLQLIQGSALPQVALAALLIEGVFERHPGLVVLVEELGISWLPHFLESIDSIAVGPYGEHFGIGRSDYKLPLIPSEYVRRQVRVTPLASADRLRPTLDLVPPGLLIFSSDVPHPEGRSRARELFEQQLDGVGSPAREQFFGGSIAELLGL
jgi:predicted TIM-barrel fold metal-dependent hydrolase